MYSTGKFSSLRFTINYGRMNSFYIRNIILPNSVLLALSSLTFFIPNNLGERVGFGVTVTLALCVNLIIVIDFVPETSKTIPNICNYFLVSIFLSGFSILLATMSINVSFWIQHLNPTVAENFRKIFPGGSSVVTMNTKLPDDVTSLSEPSGRRDSTATSVLHPEKKREKYEDFMQQAFENKKKRLENVVRIFDGVVGSAYLLATTLYSVMFIVVKQ